MGESRPSLVYAAPEGNSGYSVAARRNIAALRTVGVHVAELTLLNSEDGYLPAEVPVWATGGTLIAHCMPRSWGRLRELLRPARFIGQTVWETDHIPRPWHQELRPADEIWVPTEWNARAMRQAGLTGVHVIPHTIDDTVAVAPPLDPRPGNTMFLTVNTWDWRKRPDLVLHAYLRAFTADDPVSLVVKTDEHVLSWHHRSPMEGQVWWQVMQVVRQYPHAADVQLVVDRFSDAQMAGLVQAAGCYVSLTSSEGWGLGAFDAAVAGVPLVITGHGGQMEWVGPDHPGAVPFTTTIADHPNVLFDASMTWALADVDAAAAILRDLLREDSSVRAAAPALARRLRAQYSPAAVGGAMKAALG